MSFNLMTSIIKPLIPNILKTLQPNEDMLLQYIESLKTDPKDDIIIVISSAKIHGKKELVGAFCKVDAEKRITEQIKINVDDQKRSVFPIREIIVKLLKNL